MNEFERMIERGLHEAARTHEPRPTEVGLILTAGAQRARRRTARLGIAGVVAAGVLTAGVVTVLGGDGGGTVTAGVAGEGDGGEAGADRSPAPPESSVATAVGARPATIVVSNLTFNPVELDSSEAIANWWSTPVGDPSTGFYTVATQPGRSDSPRQTLWASDDGLRWRPLETPPPFSVTSVAVGSSSVYAVGTAPAAAGSPQSGSRGRAVVGASSDGGLTWSTVDLPVDPSSMEEAAGVGSVSMDVRVAAGPAGTIVRVVPFVSPDMVALGIAPDASWQFVGDGVAVLDFPTECSPSTIAPEALEAGATASTVTVTAEAGSAAVTETTEPPVDGDRPCDTPVVERTLGWDELGVAPDLLPFVGGRRTLLYSVGDDSALTPHSTLDLDRPVSWIDFTGDAAGYRMQGYSIGLTAAPMLAFTSPDAVTWTATELPVSGFTYEPRRWGRGAVGMEADERGVRVVFSTDGETWQETALDPVLDTVPFEGEPWLGDFVAGDHGITVLVSAARPPGTDGTPTSSTLLAPTDVTVDTTPRASTTSVVGAGDDAVYDYAILHSDDGLAWSIDVVAELTGLPATSGVRLSSLGNQTVVTVQRSAGAGAPLQPTLAVVITPTA